VSEERRYPYVAADVPEAEAEEAGARLFELGALGVEQRDATTMLKGAGAGRVTIVASFEREEDARGAANQLPEAWSARVEAVVGDAWRDEWKKHFEPFHVCDGVVVRPPWREHAAARGEEVVVLEPGRAFGTGLHETTSLVAGVLAEHRSELVGAAVLDVGCGSGILALVALRLGAARSLAVDVDMDAVDVTRENAARNALGDRLRAATTPVEDVHERFPVVLANIESRTLAALAGPIADRVEAGGLLVLSGILAEDVARGQVEDLRRAYGGLREIELRRRGEWIALVMRRRRER
jgi:ribosomal protein L11 methyltransferase